jgi:hypothetical protein
MKKILAILLLALLIAGCGRPKTEEEAIAALKRFSTEIKTNDNGRVISLHIHSSQISEADLVHLERLQSLGQLSIKHANFSGSGLVHLHAIKNLSHLRLSYPTLNDDALVISMD